MKKTLREKNVKPQTARKGLRLFPRFQFISVVAIIIILAIATLGLRLVFRAAIFNEAEQDTVRVSNLIRDIQLKRFVEEDDDSSALPAIKEEAKEAFQRKMRFFRKDFRIISIKIYNTEKEVLVSADDSLVESFDRDNAGLEIALAGDSASRHGTEKHFWDTSEAEPHDVEIVTAYVPIFKRDGTLVGVFEMNRDVTCDLAAADFRLIWAVLIMIGAVLLVFAALMRVIHRSTETIEDRNGELATTNEKLADETRERKQLEKELVTITEKERRWIGQELHDSIGQQLTGLALMTEVLEQKLAADNSSQTSYAAKITEVASQATDQIRDLARGLHPLNLDRDGLNAALSEFAASTEHIFGAKCSFDSPTPLIAKDSSVAANIYRIAQEATTNAIRHGSAKNIDIKLAVNTDHASLTIQSDGIDFQHPDPDTKGMGLKIMSYRAEMINGTIDIVTAPKGGTTVTCTFPIHNLHKE